VLSEDSSYQYKLLEFPLQRQYALARVSVLEEFERGRVILREGHRAEKFYLIVDGTSK
jgi:CRP-like cAMP-binding protein